MAAHRRPTAGLVVLVLATLGLAAPPPQAPRLKPGARRLLRQMAAFPAPSGAERPMLGALASGLRAVAPHADPRWDSLGNLSYVFPAGAARPLDLLIVSEIDQPGFVVSRIRTDGYLRVQAVQAGPGWPRQYQRLLFANPVSILTRRGWLTAVGAGLSVHLLPTRSPGQVPGYGLDDLYVDTGAGTAAQDRAAGIRLLDPVVPLTRVLTAPGDPVWTGPALSSRAAMPALAALVDELARRGGSGLGGKSIGIAFATEGYFGHHGLMRLLQEYQPHRLVLLRPHNGGTWSVAGDARGLLRRWIAASQAMPERSAPTQLDHLLGFHRRYLLIRFPVAGLHTGAELLDTRDAARLELWIERFTLAKATASAPLANWPAIPPAAASRPGLEPEPAVIRDLQALIAVTGVSQSERPVRIALRRLLGGELPPGASMATGPAGDLIVSWGPPRAARSLLFIAHMDEIGWQVEGRLPDGQLALRPEGYGLRAFYARQAVEVHAASGAVFAGELHFLPPAPAFGAAPGLRLRWLPRLDLGLSLAQEDRLGIGLGDPVAVPKVYRPLLNHRASARSMDDRVGDAALVAALARLRALEPRDRLYFVWSTGEELGLWGAKALAARLHPNTVFALDTFVSSDSPLENPRFAHAPLGHGFVIRAVDNSIITPPALVRRVRGIARAHHIPVQTGITGGGNDGSAFLAYGSQVIALGWPLRYSHSPAEVVDTRDVQALSAMVVALARNW
ncbi:MAG: M20/M25/M40 family metallo-hydrolase [Terriglobales bacterium]